MGLAPLPARRCGDSGDGNFPCPHSNLARKGHPSIRPDPSWAVTQYPSTPKGNAPKFIGRLWKFTSQPDTSPNASVD
jgi:hypothetical protein